MGKKRKTRQEKIIIQLKRKLSSQSQRESFPTLSSSSRQETSQFTFKKQISNQIVNKKYDDSVFIYDPTLIKHDIFKTVILSFIIIVLQIVLYFKMK